MRNIFKFLPVLLLMTVGVPNADAAKVHDPNHELEQLEKLTDDAEALVIRLLLDGSMTRAQREMNNRLRAMCSKSRTVRDLYRRNFIDDDPTGPSLLIEEGVHKMQERWRVIDRLRRHKRSKRRRQDFGWYLELRRLKIIATKSSRFSGMRQNQFHRQHNAEYMSFLDNLQNTNLATVQKIGDDELRNYAEQIIMNLVLLRQRIWNMKRRD